MDKEEIRRRKRRKRQQIRRRKRIRQITYLVGMLLAVVFVVRGIILPIVHHFTGKEESTQTQEEQTQAEVDPDAAVRRPLKGQDDTQKVGTLTVGWHEDDNGKWYQNADHTYYAGGFQEIDGVMYSFDSNGYVQTGWISKGVKDYYFNEDGSYDPTQKRKMLCLTFDDGPGEYTDELLDCLEENNAHATFFMLGQNVEQYPDQVKHVLEAGCEIGSHSYDHTDLLTLDLDSVKKQFEDTDNALIQACGQAATVARAPYGDWSEDIVETVGKPFFTWSVDSRDWDYKDAEKDYNAVMSGDLTDGSIILMHDIHQPTVEAAKRIIPALIEQGYKLVTVSEMAEAKGVTLQAATYSDFWQSSFDAGRIAGASSTGTEDTSTEDSTDISTEESTGTTEEESTDTASGETSETGETESADAQ